MTAAGIGIDFGTTNSALAKVEGADVRFAGYSLAGSRTPSFRSVLFFDPERHHAAPGKKPQGAAGTEAIEGYLSACGEGRLIQSIKTYLASRLFKSTPVLNAVLSIEDLVARIISELWRLAAPDLELDHPEQSHVVFGRPVHFAGADMTAALSASTPVDVAQNDDFALERLRAAAQSVGFDDVAFEYEPIAAAYHFESRLTHDAIVLVADFGGGTSDFCVMRMGPSRHDTADRTDDILATGGVDIAGDNFDARLIRHIVAPALGRGSLYTEMGQTTDVPESIFNRLERWHHLSFLKTAPVMASLQRMLRGSHKPEALQALIHVVEWNQGFHLHKCIDRTKQLLSQHDEAPFLYEDEPVRIEARVSRRDFETWIAPDVEKIGTCLDGVLAAAGVGPNDVDHVFLTGGTSFVPLVRQLSLQRFGATKIHGGDELVSIAGGLALKGRDRCCVVT